jgi:hypothetical protein
MALIAGLFAWGASVSKDMLDAAKTSAPPASRRRPQLMAGAPLRIRRKHEASRPAKHTSRTKSRKRRRAVVRMRSHRS